MMKIYRTAACALLQLLAAAAVHGQEIARVNPPGAPRPVAAYSQVTEVPPGMRLLFLAGQVGNRADGTLPPTVDEQAVQALENIRLILAGEGAGPEAVVKLNFYFAARPADMSRIAAERADMFSKQAPPPTTWVYVAGLARPEYLVEIEAVAAVPDRPR